MSRLALYVNEGKPTDPYLSLDPSLRPDTETHEGPLTINERDEWHRHRATVQRGLGTWRDTGEALLAINRKRLYRDQYGTFTECLLHEFGIGKSEAYRLMGMVEATAAQPEKLKLDNKQAVRALAEYSPETQKIVGERLAEKGINAPKVEDVRAEASQVLLESVSRQIASLPPQDQKTIAQHEDAKHVKVGRKQASKERLQKDHDKLIRWAEKLSKHLGRMENSGDWPMLKGFAAKAIVLEAELKLRLTKKGKR